MTDRTLTTYRRADGKLIDGLYGWVTDIDCYGDLDESVEIVEEVWALTSTRRFVIGETDRWCEVCDEDVTLPVPEGMPEAVPPFGYQPELIGDDDG